MNALKEAMRVFPTAWIERSAEHKHDLVVRRTNGRAGYIEATTVPVKGPATKDRQDFVFRLNTDTEREGAARRFRIGTDKLMTDKRTGNATQGRVVEVEYDGPNKVSVVVERIRPTRSVTSYRLASKLTTDGSLPTTVHEFAHRCESAHPRLLAMEHEFLHRRCADQDGAMPGTVGYHGGRKEQVFPGGFVDEYVGKDYGTRATEIMSMGTEAIFGGTCGALAGAGAGQVADPDHAAFVLGALAAL